MDHARAHTDHVGDGVEGSELVEVHVLGSHPVDLALRLGQPGEHVVGQRANVLVQAGPGEQLLDLAPGTPVRGVLDHDVTTHRGEASALYPLLDSSCTSPSATFSTASAITPSGTPASTRAPSSMSPLAPEEASTQPITAGPRRRGDSRGR